MPPNPSLHPTAYSGLRPLPSVGELKRWAFEMNADDPRAKWHLLDSTALQALTQGSATPGLVYPIGTNAVPAQVQSMPGVIAFFASSYATPMPMANAATAGAELAVVRSEGALRKAYNYIVATSSDGRVYFNGPHYHFPQHHFASSSPVPVESLFGHVPLSSKPKA